MKSFFKSALVLLALVSTTQIVAAPKANAVLLIGGYDFNAINTGPETVMCMVLFPVCILNKNGVVSSFNASFLRENNYSSAEAATILESQSKFVSSLKEQHKFFAVLKTDDAASVSAQIRSVAPSVSDLYIEAVLQAAAI